MWPVTFRNFKTNLYFKAPNLRNLKNNNNVIFVTMHSK